MKGARIEHTFVSNTSAVLADREPFVSFIPCAFVQVTGDRVLVRSLTSP